MVVALLTNNNDFLTTLGAISLYCQWWALLSVALLCFFRQWINRQSLSTAVIVSTSTCLASFISLELITQFYVRVNLPFDWQRFILLGAVIVVFTLLSLRLFSVFSLMDLRGRNESEMRVQALQSRIRPHFLFNCLNTIAELINSQPQQAEQAVEDLAMLFRASMETDAKFHTLENELSLCRRYVQLERWRLAERLTIHWQIDVADCSVWQLPKLLLQPLIENAIVHGVQSDGRINIGVDIRETKKYISIKVVNTKNSDARQSLSVDDESISKGNGIAVDNIKERLFFLYDDQQVFKVNDGAESYTVIMRLPKELFNAHRVI